jgi:hypothetical protein
MSVFDVDSILGGSQFTLCDSQERAFYLEYQNFNDYGFYTLFSLMLYVKKSPFPFRIADFKIFNKGQKTGERPVWNSSTTPFVFITDCDSAGRLFLMLSPMERNNLKQNLNILFDASSIEREPAFSTSVLRGKTFEIFKREQRVIRELIESTIDARKMIEDSHQQLALYMETLSCACK